MTATLYAGYDQPCSATVTDNGRTLRCTVWIDVARRSVESRCTVVQDNGREVELFRRRVATVTAEFGPDHLKIIAAGPIFIAQWFEGGDENGTPANPVIRRYTFYADAIETAAWTDRGTQITTRFMYDIKPVLGHATHYIVVFASTDDELVLRRYNGLTWLDTVYSVAGSGGEPVALRAIACYAHQSDDDALVVYERVGDHMNEVWCTRVDAIDGSDSASAEVLGDMAAVYLFQAGFARHGTGTVGLVCEVAEVEETDYQIPILAKVRVSGTTAAPITDAHWEHHLRLLGAPFSCAAAHADATDPNIFALVGYAHPTSAVSRNEFAQRNAFVVNLDSQSWGLGDDPQTIRPRPVMSLNLGDIDCRISGYTPDGGLVTGFGTGRRIGRIPDASAGAQRGPKLKTRTWAVLGFAKQMAVSSSSDAPLQPVAATVQGVCFQPEEPTAIHRDPSDPATPSAAYHGDNPFPAGITCEAAAGAVVGGGCLAYFDGSKLFEVGFCWWPPILDVRAEGGGTNVDGTVLYCATYEQRDALGQLHRSAPSIPVSFTAATEEIVLDIGTMTLSMRDNVFHYPSAEPIDIVLWRTEAGGVVFYRVNAQGGGGAYEPRDTDENDPTVAYITVNDNVSDADLVRQETLPWVQVLGAWTPLVPIQPPAARAIAVWQNRVWIALSQDQRLLNFSQEMLPELGGTRTLAPEFSPSLALRIDGIGRVIGMIPRDEELVVLTSDATYSVTGDGPDFAGNGATYRLSVINKTAGTIDQRSLVDTPAGIFGQSKHGLYLHQPGGATEYLQLGDHVRDTIALGGNLRGAAYDPDRGEVWWVTNGAATGSPRVVALDLVHMRWSVHPLVEGDLPGGTSAMSSAVGGCSWLGASGRMHRVVVQTGAVLIERAPTDATPFADQDRNSSEPVPLRVRLRPIHLDGIDGFQRIRRWTVALEKPNASGVQIRYSAWRSGTYEAVTPETFAYASPAEERLVINGPRVQQCAAAWIDIEEIAPVPATENLRIVGTHIEAGIKRGLRRG